MCHLVAWYVYIATKNKITQTVKCVFGHTAHTVFLSFLMFSGFVFMLSPLGPNMINVSKKASKKMS